MNEKKLNIVLNEIRNTIIVKRKFQNISQKDIAKNTGLSPSCISEYERGVRDMTLPNFIKLLGAVNALDDVYNSLKAAFK